MAPLADLGSAALALADRQRLERLIRKREKLAQSFGRVFGHGRVLPPIWRRCKHGETCAAIAREMRTAQ